MPRFVLFWLLLLTAAATAHAQSADPSAAVPAWADHTRVLPERLRGIPTGLTLTHTPTPVYPVPNPQKPGQFIWHHSTTIRAEAADLEIVEAGSFIWYSAAGWQKNLVQTPADFAALFKCPAGKLRQGQAYTFAENDRFAESVDRVYPGDALWYVLARDPRTGQLYKGLGLVETEGLRK